MFKDALLSAMSVVSRCVGRLDPTDEALPGYVEQLSALLRHDDHATAQKALRCFASLADKFSRKGADPTPLAANGLINELIQILKSSSSGWVWDERGGMTERF